MAVLSLVLNIGCFIRGSVETCERSVGSFVVSQVDELLFTFVLLFELLVFVLFVELPLPLLLLAANDSLIADVNESIDDELDFSICIYELTV
ncbi:hypothetical protein BLOT_002122 [Blomia tropicalis]|nr:hypothetical protein BLOT_002122 [Blomia tropicalis]